MQMALLTLPLVVLVAAAASQLWAAAAAAAPIGLANCSTRCGEVLVPYPFGIGPPRCSWPGFNLTCDTSRGGQPRLLIGDGTLRVTEISVFYSNLRVVRDGPINITITTSADEKGGTAVVPGVDLGGLPYLLAARNEFILVGCNVQATLLGDRYNYTDIVGGCVSTCSHINNGGSTMGTFDRNLSAAAGDHKYCSGMGCCQSPVLVDSTPKGVLFRQFQQPNTSHQQQLQSPPPVLAFVAEEGWFDQTPVFTKLLASKGDLLKARLEAPLLLAWAVSHGLPAPAINDKSFQSWPPCPEEVANRLCKSNNTYCGQQNGGYTCMCFDGYEGNPYVTDGCQDVNECDHPTREDVGCYGECTNTIGWYECRCPRGSHGDPTRRDGCVKSLTGLITGIGVGSGAASILLVLLAIFIHQRFKQRRAIRLKRKFFKQNRGQLLQQLVSQRADIAERMIIPVDELAKATNNFDKARELGGGGHGTVYKGILSDLHVVAIKKSKITIQKEIDEFINEVSILSQINHRNVVKLFGCCLETEVPLLVYEFISNGTLYHHLHVNGPKSLSWVNRLRVATEISNALAYLHSSVSIPIIHRDIKSSNILLDDTLTSKVSDFGASRYIPIEKTGLTTRVQGTIGYLDPMYFYTGRLNEKSDVYSFGVMLVELLTRKKPFSYLSPDGDGLVAHFAGLFSEGNLVQILDPQVTEEGGTELEEVAALAASCINLRGEERPTMRQVEHTLEGLRVSKTYRKDSMIAEEFEQEDSIVMDCPSTKEEQIIKESSRRYSMEREILMSARYPR